MENKEKLVELIRYYAGGSQAGFSRMTGLSTTSISRMVSGKMPVTEKKLIQIGEVIPEARQFLVGKADLPREKTMLEQIAERDARIEELKNELALKDRVIQALLARSGF